MRSPEMLPGLPVGSVTTAVLQTIDDDAGEGLIISVVLFGIGLFLVYDGFRNWQQKRLMQDTPTEKVRSAAIGRTELVGTGHPIEEPLERPFGTGECLVATYEIEEWEDDDDGGGSWRTVEDGVLCGPFSLDDGTGRMRVEPDRDATFEIKDEHEHRIRVKPNQRESDRIRDFLRTHTDEGIPPSGGITGLLFAEDRRYTERWIPVGATLYVLGATEPSGGEGPRNADSLVFRRDRASDEFIISERSEAALIGQYEWLAPAKIAGGIALSAICLYGILYFVGVA